VICWSLHASDSTIGSCPFRSRRAHTVTAGRGPRYINTESLCTANLENMRAKQRLPATKLQMEGTGHDWRQRIRTYVLDASDTRPFLLPQGQDSQKAPRLSWIRRRSQISFEKRLAVLLANMRRCAQAEMPCFSIECCQLHLKFSVTTGHSDLERLQQSNKPRENRARTTSALRRITPRTRVGFGRVGRGERGPFRADHNMFSFLAVFRSHSWAFAVLFDRVASPKARPVFCRM